MSVTSNYGKSPQIVLDRNNLPHVWYRGAFNGGPNTLAYTRWTGTAWTYPADWGSTKYFEQGMFDNSNVLNYAYRDNPTGSYEVYFRTYDLTSWSVPELVSAGADTSKVDYANMLLNTHGWPHVVWSERKNNASPNSSVYFSMRGQLGPPGPPTSFTPTPANTQVTLSWTNPSEVTFYATMIRFKTTGYPTGPTDGTLLSDKAGTLGSTDSVLHTGLVNGQTYYYAAFAHDNQGGFSDGVLATARPFGPGDYDHDGDVDQDDFGSFQLCYSGPYIPQTNPACAAMRLDGDGDVDVDDANLFADCISGPSLPANPACLP